MKEEPKKGLSGYFREAESWAADKERSRLRLQRLAWIIAGGASTIAIFEAVALVALAPLKTVVPYTLLVDRQTGYVQALKPLDTEVVAPDAALTRSFLAQYVIARESFDIGSLRDDYHKVALWSAGEARDRYVAAMQASNPQSPLATLPRTALIAVEIRSISSLSNQTALVRFSTVRTDGGRGLQTPQIWAAVISYRYAVGAMSEADRLLNPLGFQVTRYRRNAETAPVASTDQTQAPSGGAPAIVSSRVSPSAQPPAAP
jgi:type IV secretion system protein VirB8